jgi:aminopeptidase-like protein
MTRVHSHEHRGGRRERTAAPKMKRRQTKEPAHPGATAGRPPQLEAAAGRTPGPHGVHRQTSFSAGAAAEKILSLAAELTPICRSITGEGLRQTLRILARHIPLTLHEIPTGTRVCDWIVPKEWNIRDAYLKNPDGARVVDFHKCSLHVVNYSLPVKTTMTRAELEPHLHSIPGRPRAIPYRTSYYRETWGFCLSQEQRDNLGDGPFKVCIDSTLEPGSLTYGELGIPGETSDEVLISTHCCHPYMANDNLSGIGIALELAKRLLRTQPRLSYRFLFIPGTIGSIAWLARNDPSHIRHGLVLSCLGDPGALTYKKTRLGDAVIDRVAAHVLKASGFPCAIEDFIPYGYDERQYNSPGFKLPVGCLMRTPNGRFEQYHTSDDNLDFISAEALAGSFETLCSIVELLEANLRYRNLSPRGEPQLGKRGLYDGSPDEMMALLWVLNFSDGGFSLLDIAERAKIPFAAVKHAADRLAAAGLLGIAPDDVA